MSFMERMLRWIVIGGIFIMPTIALVVFDSLFFPYITGKNFVFRVVVEVIAGAWLALALAYPKYRPRRSWILYCFAIFVAVMAIADAQGVMPFKSFWSNYERMDGWVTLIHTLILIVVAACVMDTEKLWRRLFQWSLAISALISILGLFQVAGSGLEGRIDLTFGNPIYLAVYMLFHVFLAALLWHQLWIAQKPGERWASWFYAAAMVLDVLALLLSGTRGATLGLVFGAFLALALYAFSRDGSRRLRRWTTAVFVVLLVAAGGLRLAKDTSFVQSVGILNRLSSISLSDNDTLARILNIEMAWKGIEERPILGWGQENYAIVFDKFYDPRMYAQEQWFDRVHDVIFDWWVAGGTLGLLAYLSIFAAALYTLWKSQAFSRAERAILVGLLAGYFIHLITVFDSITSYILFALVLGYVVWRDASRRGTKPLFEKRLVPSGSLPVVAAIATVFVLGVAWWVNAAALAENQDIIAAISPQSDPSANLSYFQKAISYGTYGTQEAREQLSQFAVSVLGASSVSTSVKTQFVQYAVGELDAQSQWSPLDARFPLFAGAVLDAAGDYKDAGAELERAHELSPQKQTILFEMAQNYGAEGDIQDELSAFQAAFNLDADDLDARLYYAAALISAGQSSQAQTILAPVIQSGQAADSRIAQAYASKGEYAALIPIWQAAIKADPQNGQNYFTLAAAYYATGNHAQAIAILQSAEAAVPGTQPQAQQLIQEIQSGTVNVSG